MSSRDLRSQNGTQDDFLDEPTSLKVVLLGDADVGKSCLVQRFVKDSFSLQKVSTSQRVAFEEKNLVLDGRKIQLAIWDTAGQEKYRSLAPIYYRDADVAIVVYDLTKPHSFDALRFWIHQLQSHLRKGRTAVAVVANKADLAGNRKVDEEEARRYAEEIEALYTETSAKTGENVGKLFIDMTRLGLEKHDALEEEVRRDQVVNEPRQTDCCNV